MSSSAGPWPPLIPSPTPASSPALRPSPRGPGPKPLAPMSQPTALSPKVPVRTCTCPQPQGPCPGRPRPKLQSPAPSPKVPVRTPPPVRAKRSGPGWCIWSKFAEKHSELYTPPYSGVFTSTERLALSGCYSLADRAGDQGGIIIYPTDLGASTGAGAGAGAAPDDAPASAPS